MTDKNTRFDDDLDRKIRAASERPIDEDAIFRSVARVIDERQTRWRLVGLPSFGPNVAAAAFAATLFVAGFAGYSLPDLALDTAGDDVLLLAMGDPGVIGASFLPNVEAGE